MPHYVVEDDEDAPGTFFIYSTIVDNTLMDENIGPLDMFLVLAASIYSPPGRNYSTWINPDHTPNTDDKMYWYQVSDAPKLGFWYVKQSDHWYTLPKSSWRNE